MKLKIEADPEPEIVRIWWNNEFNGKPYGAFLRVRLPIDHLEPYLEELKRDYSSKMNALALESEE